MEDWRPSDDDDLFDFDTGEAGSPRPGEPDPYDTGEFGRARRRSFGTAEEPPDDPYRTPTRRRGPEPDPFDEPFETGEARRRASERGDPFDTGEYRQRRAGRPRHRDLPANIRRRQDFAVAGLVLLFFLGVYLLFFRGGGEEAREELPLKRLAGQTLVGKLGAKGVDQELLKRVEKGQLGGVIVSTDNEADLQRDASKLQAAAARGGNPPVLIMVDQEGGHVKRLPGPPELFPEEIADGGVEAATAEGQATGEYLATLGVNVNLAPVVDVAHTETEDTIVSRTYSDDPSEVGELGAAFVTAMQAAGVGATAKHFPGLGLATANTDFEQVQVQGTDEEIQADLEPFRQAIAAGTDLVMVSSAIFPDLSGAKPAVFSANVIQNELRGKLGFQGVVISDDLEAPGASETATPGSAALQMLRAGGDLALFAQTEGASASALRAIVKAVREGRLDSSVVQAAYDRVLALKDKLSGKTQNVTPPADTDSEESAGSGGLPAPTG